MRWLRSKIKKPLSNCAGINMHRFFFETCQAFQNDITDLSNQDNIVTLSQEESRHAAQVLRLTPGTEIVLLDGIGHVYSAHIISVKTPRVMARVAGALPNHEPIIKVTLYQGLPKADKMEWIAQKCTELGVHAIQPVYFSRCDKGPGKNNEKSNLRCQRIVRETVKQCGRGVVPAVAFPVAFEDALPMIRSHGLAFATWEEERKTRIADFFPPGARDIAIVIGPEGGITPAEVSRLVFSGAFPVTLGKRILRTETAGMAALASIMTLVGEL